MFENPKNSVISGAFLSGQYVLIIDLESSLRKGVFRIIRTPAFCLGGDPLDNASQKNLPPLPLG